MLLRVPHLSQFERWVLRGGGRALRSSLCKAFRTETVPFAKPERSNRPLELPAFSRPNVSAITAPKGPACDIPAMRDAQSYGIFRKLETGEFVQVGTREDLHQAQHLIQSLYEFWPAEYEVRPVPPSESEPSPKPYAAAPFRETRTDSDRFRRLRTFSNALR